MQKVPAVSPEYRSLNRAMGAINENFEELTPIIGVGEDRETLRRVGPGLDFETFHEAMMWATTVTVNAYTVIVLQLEEGLHFAGNYSTTGTLPIYIIAGREILIRATGATAKPVITVGKEIIKQSIYLFHVYNGGKLSLLNVDVDVTAGGNLKPWGISGFYVKGNSFLTLRGGNNIVVGFPLWIEDSTVEITSPVSITALSDPDPAVTLREVCIFANGGSSVRIWAFDTKLKLTGEYKGLQSRNGGVIVYNADGVIFSPTPGFEFNTNPPVNVIQFDGSLISDQTTALTFATTPPP